jgi:pimeloyl-ACP methyl ester carboxylesterase
MRSSTIITKKDSAGPYEVEIFEAPSPKSIVVCSHGNGVRRWDGERFFYEVANHYPVQTFLLVDQNQPMNDGCKLNELAIMVSRVQGLIALAQQKYPGIPITILGHSMGCGIVTRLDLSGVAKIIFVAPAAGNATQKLIERYGPKVADGLLIKTSDGLTKLVSKEYFDSVQGIVWEEEYKKLLQNYKDVYVFESGDEEIVGDERLAHRDLPFADYKIISGATHNYAGEALQKLYTELDAFL